jgi:hypothetical protein
MLNFNLNKIVLESNTDIKKKLTLKKMWSAVHTKVIQ